MNGNFPRFGGIAFCFSIILNLEQGCKDRFLLFNTPPGKLLYIIVFPRNVLTLKKQSYTFGSAPVEFLGAIFFLELRFVVPVMEI